MEREPSQWACKVCSTTFLELQLLNGKPGARAPGWATTVLARPRRPCGQVATRGRPDVSGRVDPSRVPRATRVSPPGPPRGASSAPAVTRSLDLPAARPGSLGASVSSRLSKCPQPGGLMAA